MNKMNARIFIFKKKKALIVKNYNLLKKKI